MVLEMAEKTKTKPLYVPDIATITETEALTPTEKKFVIQFDDKEKRDQFTFFPGQFLEVTVFGIGEAPFSIPSSPNQKGSFELCVRNIGSVSGAMHKLQPGSKIGIRGPFGKGYFPYEKMKGNNVVIIAGGLGLAPVRSLIKLILEDRKSYKGLTLIYGCVEPGLLLYQNEVEELSKRDDIDVMLTVDRPDESWKESVGVCTNLIPGLKYLPEDTFAVVCGPPIMYRFVMIELEEKHYKPENIFLDMERRMECGVGKCNHCHIGDKLCCVDGPIFSLWEIKNLKEAL